MEILKVVVLGFLIIGSDNVVEFNRSAIMKEGWRLKKAGNKRGLSDAWKAARVQMDNMKEMIKETQKAREEYIETYWMTFEVAGDFIEEEITDLGMKDAIADYKKIVKLADDIGLLDKEKELDKTWQQVEKDQAIRAFEETQKERLNKFLRKEVA